MLGFSLIYLNNIINDKVNAIMLYITVENAGTTSPYFGTNATFIKYFTKAPIARQIPGTYNFPIVLVVLH